MTFLEFRLNLDKYIIFSLNDILLLDPSFSDRRLYEWSKKGNLINIRRGYYVFSDTLLNEPALYLIANIIYNPSYVSLETALSIYGLIPETVYSITSVSTKKKTSFKTRVATFSYKHIKPDLFFGYDLVEYSGRRYQMASIEKCVLDYLYLHPEMKDQDSFEAWRFNAAVFREGADMGKFDLYLEAFNNKSLRRRVEAFKKYIGI